MSKAGEGGREPGGGVTMGHLFRQPYMYCSVCWELAVGQATLATGSKQSGRQPSLQGPQPGAGTRRTGPRSWLFPSFFIHPTFTGTSPAPGPGMQSKYISLSSSPWRVEEIDMMQWTCSDKYKLPFTSTDGSDSCPACTVRRWALQRSWDGQPTGHAQVSD